MTKENNVGEIVYNPRESFYVPFKFYCKDCSKKVKCKFPWSDASILGVKIQFADKTDGLKQPNQEAHVQRCCSDVK